MPVSQAFPHHWVCAMGKHFKLGGVKNGRELVPQKYISLDAVFSAENAQSV